jgi:hypothetical protein
MESKESFSDRLSWALFLLVFSRYLSLVIIRDDLRSDTRPVLRACTSCGLFPQNARRRPFHLWLDPFSLDCDAGIQEQSGAFKLAFRGRVKRAGLGPNSCLNLPADAGVHGRNYFDGVGACAIEHRAHPRNPSGSDQAPCTTFAFGRHLNRFARCPGSPPMPCPSRQHSSQYTSSSQPAHCSVASLLQMPGR